MRLGSQMHSKCLESGSENSRVLGPFAALLCGGEIG